MTILDEVRGLLAYLKTNDPDVIANNLSTAVIPTVEKLAHLLGDGQSATVGYEDEQLLPWIGGVMEGKPTPAGGFLRDLVTTALHADRENYPVLRPALMAMAQKYPRYHDPLWALDGRHRFLEQDERAGKAQT